MVRRKQILLAGLAVALPFAAALAVRVLTMKRSTTMLIEATFADGFKTSFSFPARNPCFPKFQQPVAGPAGECRRIASIRISTDWERLVPALNARPEKLRWVEVELWGLGAQFFNNYDLFLAEGGPFIRRVQPSPPSELKVPGIRDEWCGVPEALRLGVLAPSDDRTLVHEAMAFLASLCDRPDLPFQLDELKLSDFQQTTEKALRDLRQSAAAR